jgi:hypothetical protein
MGRGRNLGAAEDVELITVAVRTHALKQARRRTLRRASHLAQARREPRVRLLDDVG